MTNNLQGQMQPQEHDCKREKEGVGLWRASGMDRTPPFAYDELCDLGYHFISLSTLRPLEDGSRNI